VFFHLDEGGNEQNDIYAVTRDGRVKAVVEIEGQAIISDISSDSSRILFLSSRDGQMNIYSYDINSGDLIKLTEYNQAAYGAIFSPDCNQIAYGANETDEHDNGDVYVMDDSGTDKRNLEIGAVGAEAVPNDWDLDGSRLLVTDNTPDLARTGVYNLTTDEVQWLGDDTYNEEGIEFLDSERVLISRSRDVITMPVVYDLTTGNRRELNLPDGEAYVSSQSLNGSKLTDGRIVLTHTTPTSRTDLLAYDLDSDEYEVLIEAEYGPFEPNSFTDAKYFKIESNGIPETTQRAVDHDPYETLEIGCLLYDSGERPSPLVVNPHGGPQARDTMSFDIFTQGLVACGFTVLQVNYRGSTGRSRAFIEELHDDWGGAEQGDIATAAEHLLNYDWIDEDHVVIFGVSYGGYSAYWQSVQFPDIYDAIVAWNGLTDLVNMYEDTRSEFTKELIQKYLGDPDENPDLYEERSPVTHVENVDSPLLIVHGVNDSRVPVSQGRIFRDALIDAGYIKGQIPTVNPDKPDATAGEFEYRELSGEGHTSTDQKQKLRFFQILRNFLERRTSIEEI
jgi:dipeptidyl aminopeptidase/acylaminoacyl peptidase